MTFLIDPRDYPRSPQFAAVVGAASPLWAYFGAAAAMGAAFWWMNQWRASGLAALAPEGAQPLETPAAPPAAAALAPPTLTETAAEPEPPVAPVVPPEPAALASEPQAVEPQEVRPPSIEAVAIEPAAEPAATPKVRRAPASSPSYDA